MCVCRHISVILGCVTDQQSWGEEAVAIHVRHLIAFSYWNVVADLPLRAAYDFLGHATAKITKAQLMEYRTIQELITKSTVPFEVDVEAPTSRMGLSTCSMRQAKHDLQAPFNKLCNTLFKKITSANTLSALKTNNDTGMTGLRSLISQFADAAATSGDSTKRIKAAGESTGKRKKFHAGDKSTGVAKKHKSRNKDKHLTSKK
jgi:hypothetical protein